MKQALRILELAMNIKELKDYDIHVEWCPHVCGIRVYSWAGYRRKCINGGVPNYEISWMVYLDQPDHEKELDKIIKKLESLC